jgi:hypothetical protein
VTSLDFLSLKNDANVPSKSNKKKTFYGIYSLSLLHTASTVDNRYLPLPIRDNKKWILGIEMPSSPSTSPSPLPPPP